MRFIFIVILFFIVKNSVAMEENITINNSVLMENLLSGKICKLFNYLKQGNTILVKWSSDKTVFDFIHEHRDIIKNNNININFDLYKENIAFLTIFEAASIHKNEVIEFLKNEFKKHRLSVFSKYYDNENIFHKLSNIKDNNKIETLLKWGLEEACDKDSFDILESFVSSLDEIQKNQLKKISNNMKLKPHFSHKLETLK